MLANDCTLLDEERAQVGEKSNVSYWLRLIRETAQDWKTRHINKPRNILPAHGDAALALRCIRRQACKAGGTVDCDAWSAGELDYEPFSNPCISCGAPGLGLVRLSVELWGVHNGGNRAGKLLVDEADLRGWMNGRTPIQPDRLRTAVVNAWRKGWLSTTQAVTATSACADLEAAGSVARRVLKRFRRGGIVSDPEEIAIAVEGEREQMDQVAVAKFERNHNIPRELKGMSRDFSKLQLLEEMRQICPTKGVKTC